MTQRFACLPLMGKREKKKGREFKSIGVFAGWGGHCQECCGVVDCPASCIIMSAILIIGT